jgi:hypothetical protein
MSTNIVEIASVELGLRPNQDYVTFESAVPFPDIGKVKIYVNPAIILEPSMTEAFLLREPANHGKVINLLFSTFTRADVLEAIKKLRGRDKLMAAAIAKIKYAEMIMDGREKGFVDTQYTDRPNHRNWRFMTMPPMSLTFTPSWAWEYASHLLKDLLLMNPKEGRGFFAREYVGYDDPIGLCCAVAMMLQHPVVDKRTFCKTFIDDKPMERVENHFVVHENYMLPVVEKPKEALPWVLHPFHFSEEKMEQAVARYMKTNLDMDFVLEGKNRRMYTTWAVLMTLAEEVDIALTLKHSKLRPLNRPLFDVTLPRNPIFYCEDFPPSMTFPEFQRKLVDLIAPKGYDLALIKTDPLYMLEALVPLFYYRRKTAQWMLPWNHEKGIVYLGGHTGIEEALSLRARAPCSNLEGYQEMILCASQFLGHDIVKEMMLQYRKIYTDSSVQPLGVPYSEVRHTDHHVDMTVNKTFSVRSGKAPKIWTMWKSGNQWLERPNLFCDQSHLVIVIDSKEAPSLIVQSDLAPAWETNHLPFSGFPFTFEYLNSSRPKLDSRFHFPDTSCWAVRMEMAPDMLRYKHASLFGGARPSLFWLTFRWANGEFIMLPLMPWTRPLIAPKKGRSTVRSKKGISVTEAKRTAFFKYPLAFVIADGFDGFPRDYMEMEHWSLTYPHADSQANSVFTTVVTDIARYCPFAQKVEILGLRQPIFDVGSIKDVMGLGVRHNTTLSAAIVPFETLPSSIKMEIDSTSMCFSALTMAEEQAEEEKMIIVSEKPGRGRKRKNGQVAVRRVRARHTGEKKN